MSAERRFFIVGYGVSFASFRDAEWYARSGREALPCDITVDDPALRTRPVVATIREDALGRIWTDVLDSRFA